MIAGGTHSHQEMEEVYYVTRGIGAMVIDGEEKEVAVGDVIYIPFGSTHLAKNKGTSPFEYLWVISPPILPDFLKKRTTT